MSIFAAKLGETYSKEFKHYVYGVKSTTSKESHR